MSSNFFRNIFQSWAEPVYLLLPTVIGYSVSAACGFGRDSSKKAGDLVSFRPPPWVFGVVWPFLFLFTGVSWVLSSRISHLNSIPFGLLSLLLGGWILVYSQKCLPLKSEEEDPDGLLNKKWGVWVFALIFGSEIAALVVSKKSLASQLLLTPLIAWTVLAWMINAAEVQELS